MVTIPTSAKLFENSEPYLRGNYRIPLRREIVRELIGQPRGKRILDLGCGDGAISLAIADGNQVTLVDNSSAMLEAARANFRAAGMTDAMFIQADAASLAARDMDIVIALGVLAHVDDVEAVIAAIARHLKPGGLAILQFSDKDRFLYRIGRVLWAIRGRGYTLTSRAQVLALVERHGLRKIDERNHLVHVPGVQRLLGPALIPYDRFSRRIPMLARHGTDTILLLCRVGGGAGNGSEPGD